MKNIDIINQYMQQKNITCAFRTIPEWNRDGYRVIKGEKAHTLEVWQPYRSGKRTVFKLTKKHYFTADQVTNKAAVMTESITETVTKQPETSVTEQIQEQQPETVTETSVNNPLAIYIRNGWITDPGYMIHITGMNEQHKQFEYKLLYPADMKTLKMYSKALSYCTADELRCYQDLIRINPNNYYMPEQKKMIEYLEKLAAEKEGTAEKVKLSADQKLAVKIAKQCFKTAAKSQFNAEIKNTLQHYIAAGNYTYAMETSMFMIHAGIIPGTDPITAEKMTKLINGIQEKISNDQEKQPVKLPLLASLPHDNSEKVKLLDNTGLQAGYLKTLLKAGITEVEYSPSAYCFTVTIGKTTIGIMQCGLR